jgi:hypothetical protein
LAADAAQAKDMPYFLNSSRLTQLIAWSTVKQGYQWFDNWPSGITLS